MTPVFFYGLFMDEKRLKTKGLHPSKPKCGYVEGYSLKIGERATLIKSAGERAYGTIMALDDDELAYLYQAPSVADYRPETILATTFDNESLTVVVYNLPLEKLSAQNKQYAQLLSDVASDIGLPAAYVKKIKMLVR